MKINDIITLPKQVACDEAQVKVLEITEETLVVISVEDIDKTDADYSFEVTADTFEILFDMF